MRKYDVVIRRRVTENAERAMTGEDGEAIMDGNWGEMCVVNHAERRYGVHVVRSLESVKTALFKNRFRIGTIVLLEGNLTLAEVTTSSDEDDGDGHHPYARTKCVEIPAAFHPAQTTSVETAARVYVEAMKGDNDFESYVETDANPLRVESGGVEEPDTSTCDVETLEYILPDRDAEITTFYETDEGAALFAECLGQGKMWSPETLPPVVDLDDFPRKSRWKWTCERKAPPIVLDRLESVRKYVIDFIKVYDVVKPWYETVLPESSSNEKEKEEEKEVRKSAEATKRSMKPSIEELNRLGKACETIEGFKKRWSWKLLGWFDIMNRQKCGDAGMIQGEKGTGWVLSGVRAPLRNSLLIDGIECESSPVVYLTGDNDTGKTTTTRIACLYALVCETLGLKIPAKRFVYPSFAARSVRFFNNGGETTSSSSSLSSLGNDDPRGMLRVFDDVFMLSEPLGSDRITAGFVVVHNRLERWERRDDVARWISKRTEVSVTYSPI